MKVRSAGHTLSRVVSIIGYQGSGKSTIARKTAGSFGTGHIEVSDIVRAITNIEKRENLSATAYRTKKNPDWLATHVLDQLQTTAESQCCSTAILSGAREEYLHTFLRAEDLDLWVIELWTQPWTRYQRLKSLSKVRSIEEFLDQDIREKAMGLDKIMHSAPIRVPTSNETNPEHLASAIKARIDQGHLR